MPTRPGHRVVGTAGYTHAGAPGLKAARGAQGVTLEALSELTGYPADFLRRMEEEGQTAPRIVTSRISAVLGVAHLDVRSELPGQVTRIRDIK